jgi:hypothetical protein
LASRALPLLVPLLLTGSPHGFCYEDGAPPGHTGGFDEPDCSLCHSDGDKNSPEGTLQVDGLPDEYSPGERYEVAVVLKHPELRSGGFQLAVRSANGESAGKLTAASDRLRPVAVAGNTYLQHSTEGRRPTAEGVIQWVFHWTAPTDAAAREKAPVYLHVAANAANDDFSALGDYIFTLERVLRKKSE